jgi:hypothetical protein
VRETESESERGQRGGGGGVFFFLFGRRFLFLTKGMVARGRNTWRQKTQEEGYRRP